MPQVRALLTPSEPVSRLSVPSSARWSWQYPFHRKKTINGAITQFLYDGLNPVQELNASNVATANLLTGLNIDEFFSRTDSSGARSFLTDIPALSDIPIRESLPCP